MNDSTSNDVTQGLQSRPQESDSAAKHPEWIGRFRIERVLGQGGFGIVYLAKDEQLNRRVAVKVPHAALISLPEDAEIYLTEARTVANLDHPGIVPVHDVGSTDEYPCYVVSKYIPGTDLATKLKQKRLPYRAAHFLKVNIWSAHPNMNPNEIGSRITNCNIQSGLRVPLPC